MTDAFADTSVEMQSIASLRNGNHKVFEDIFKAWYSPLCTYARSILHDTDDAEDVVQKMFCTLWDKHSDLEVHTSLGAYLYRSVHNACLNQVKHRNVHSEYQNRELQANSEAGDSLHEVVVHNELEAAFRDALQKLPEQCRRVFELSREEQLSYPEIAERLHISRNTVENHISKALRLLRQMLKDFLVVIVVVARIVVM
ncbi:DNA-directed RNA polymerase sigma-70 factor [Bacteroidia bacterium]|nr:DNA-directed RNA polymerase sigma-70 factor [Bacteroidia bacterium]